MNQTEVLSYKVSSPFEKVRETLATLPEIDGISAGLSPITFRILTKKNKFINIGLEELSKTECQIAPNHNSFSVTAEEMADVYRLVTTSLEGLGSGRELQGRKGLPGKEAQV